MPKIIQIILLLILSSLLGCSEGSNTTNVTPFNCKYNPVADNANVQGIYDYHKTVATKAGLCGIKGGIANTIADLIKREWTVESLIGVAVIESDYDDGFIAMQVLEDYVLYSFDAEKTWWCKDYNECEHETLIDGTKVLIRKVPNVVYLEGQSIDINNFFIFLGVQSYETVAGSTAQAFVFEELPEINGCKSGSLRKREC